VPLAAAASQGFATKWPAGSSFVLGAFRLSRPVDKAVRQLGFVIALSFGLAISASAHGRASSVPMHGFSAPARGSSGSARRISGPGRATGFRHGFGVPPLVGTPLNPNFAPIRGVPGFGFDFEHLAAIERPFRDRFGHQRRGLFFTPLFFDALPFSYPYDSEMPDYYSEAEQQPQFIAAPQLQPNVPPPAETAPRQSAAPQPSSAPPPELGQLILVRSDGQVLLAVAFTVRNGQLTYITSEGTRRSFPVSELDKEATRQMNDANGTTVSLPK
jgi:hypothetical protein